MTINIIIQQSVNYNGLFVNIEKIKYPKFDVFAKTSRKAFKSK